MRRYAEPHGISSPLDPISDVLVLLEYLTSHDYLVSTLHTRHGIAEDDAAERAKSIIPHVKTGTAFVQQSLCTPPDLSFLPAYYGLLNLLKVYILVGPHHAELPKHRWHGASYPVDEKDSRNLLTEHIDIKKGGAIPLFYRTITGQPLKPTRVTMGDIYPFVSGIGAEYSLATGSAGKIRNLRLGGQPHAKYRGKQTCTAQVMRGPGDSAKYSPRDFKVLARFRQSSATPDIFTGMTVPERCNYNDPTYRSQFRPFMIYDFNVHGDYHVISSALSSQRLLLFEELPIVLLFFHIGSVVRYKPEFMARIRNSRFWPMLAAARQHCILRFLILAWSFIHNRNLEITHRLH